MRQIFSHRDSLTPHLWLCSVCQQYLASQIIYRPLAVLILTSLGRRLLPRPSQQHTVPHIVVSTVGWGLLSRDTLSISNSLRVKRMLLVGFSPPPPVSSSLPRLPHISSKTLKTSNLSLWLPFGLRLSLVCGLLILSLSTVKYPMAPCSSKEDCGLLLMQAISPRLWGSLCANLPVEVMALFLSSPVTSRLGELGCL